LLPVTLLVLSSFLWGCAWIPLKALERLGMSGLSMTAVAAGSAGLVLVPVAVRQRASWRGRGAVGLVLIFLLGGYANLAFSTALVYGEVVRVMVLFYLLPVWGVMGGYSFLGERVGPARLVAVASALAGAVLVLGGFSALRGSVTWVDLLAVSSGLSFAGSNLVFRARQELPLVSKAAAMLLGSGVLATLGLALGLQSVVGIQPTGVVWALAYGVGWLLFATLGGQFGVTHLEAGRSSIIIIIELLVAVASAVLVGGERMDTLEIAGGLLILTAAVLEARQAAPEPAPPARS
jgi:drug/metabolite transporter (DMT)-like permease